MRRPALLVLTRQHSTHTDVSCRCQHHILHHFAMQAVFDGWLKPYRSLEGCAAYVAPPRVLFMCGAAQALVSVHHS